MENNHINNQLAKAVYERNLEKVKALLSAGANVNYRIESSYNDEVPILYRAFDVKITRELLLRGAGVNATNNYRESSLDYAITAGKELAIVRELLKHGARVNATNRKGNTALNLAVRRCRSPLEVVRELLEYGADINIQNRVMQYQENYNSPLDNAVAASVRYAKLLIKFTLIRNFETGYKQIINLDPYKEYNCYSELSSCLCGCVDEALQMKTDVIKDGVTVYDLFKTKFDIHALCNNPLSVRLSKIDYSVRYPIYNDLILYKMKPFLERADLLNKLSNIQFYTRLNKMNQDVEKRIILDHDSTYNITKYLSNDNLLNLVEAFDVLNMDTTQSLNSSKSLVEPDTRHDDDDDTCNDTKKRARLE